VEILDSRRLGGTWTLERVWERLGIGKAAAGRRLDGQVVERVVFALVAQRALEPGSKLAGTKWVAERVAVEGCPGFTDDAAYAAMDFLPGALNDIAAEVFASVAHLLNLDLDLVFVDTTSTYWEVDVADELADRAGQAGVRALQGLPYRPAAGRDRDGSHPRAGCRFGAGRSRATPPTPRSSGPSPATWPAGTCTGCSGPPTAASPPREPRST